MLVIALLYSWLAELLLSKLNPKLFPSSNCCSFLCSTLSHWPFLLQKGKTFMSHQFSTFEIVVVFVNSSRGFKFIHRYCWDFAGVYGSIRYLNSYYDVDGEAYSCGFMLSVSGFMCFSCFRLIHLCWDLSLELLCIKVCLALVCCMKNQHFWNCDWDNGW